MSPSTVTTLRRALRLAAVAIDPHGKLSPDQAVAADLAALAAIATARQALRTPRAPKGRIAK